LLDDKIDLATVNVALSVPQPAGGGLPSPLKVLVRSVEVSLVFVHAVANGVEVLLVAALWLVPASLFLLLVGRPLWHHLDAIRARIPES
jgi:hypothetical protein